MRESLPPGPRLPAALQSVGMWKRPLPFFERCRARYGKRFTTRFLGAPPFVHLADPAQVKEVFTAPPEVLHPGEGAKVLEPVVGSNSVILLDERPHMEQRKLMLPAFHGESMQRLSGLMSDVAEREVAAWPREEPISLHPRMQRLTLEIILRAVFGLDPGERLDLLRERLAALLTFGDRPISLMPPPAGGLLERGLRRVGPLARFLHLQEQADTMIFELVDERRGDGGGGRDDVLAMLLAARHEDGSPMSPQELRDELMTLLVAGHETTASSLAWAFERLCRSPRVLARLVEEVDANGGSEYLSATIQETLRHRPVLPNVAPRLVVEPFEVGGWRYPPGVCLVGNAYLIHHDPEIYPDPYVFRPERFLEQPPGTYTWIPFGGGRRRCLGASFALQEMQIVLRKVLAACELRPGDGGAELARRRNITIMPAEGARAVLGERSPSPARPQEKLVEAA
jgi:cytochrome P450